MCQAQCVCHESQRNTVLCHISWAVYFAGAYCEYALVSLDLRRLKRWGNGALFLAAMRSSRNDKDVVVILTFCFSLTLLLKRSSKASHCNSQLLVVLNLFELTYESVISLSYVLKYDILGGKYGKPMHHRFPCLTMGLLGVKIEL